MIGSPGEVPAVTDLNGAIVVIGASAVATGRAKIDVELNRIAIHPVSTGTM